MQTNQVGIYGLCCTFLVFSYFVLSLLSLFALGVFLVGLVWGWGVGVVLLLCWAEPSLVIAGCREMYLVITCLPASLLLRGCDSALDLVTASCDVGGFQVVFD